MDLFTQMGGGAVAGAEHSRESSNSSIKNGSVQQALSFAISNIQQLQRIRHRQAAFLQQAAVFNPMTMSAMGPGMVGNPVPQLHNNPPPSTTIQ